MHLQNAIYDSSSPLCEMDKFEDVMKLMKRHAVALDANLTTFTRVWVLEELYTANVRMNLVTDYCGTVSKSSMKSPNIHTVEDAQASIQADKDRILEGIRRGPGGVAAFDQVMSINIGAAIAALRAF
jgi:urocanate hydratase